ncbi:hypothetical protein ACQP3C_28090, partial [Escherichia coli]
RKLHLILSLKFKIPASLRKSREGAEIDESAALTQISRHCSHLFPFQDLRSLSSLVPDASLNFSLLPGRQCYVIKMSAQEDFFPGRVLANI